AARQRSALHRRPARTERGPVMTSRASLRLLKRALVITLLSTAVVSPASAQERPIVFVHGFGSSGDTWAGAPLRLQTNLAIQTATPSLSASSLYEQQANELQWQAGGFGSDIIAVGHSNGGLVARQWSRQHPVSGILTVGTPHGGAPLVRNLGSYAGFN